MVSEVPRLRRMLGVRPLSVSRVDWVITLCKCRLKEFRQGHVKDQDDWKEYCFWKREIRDLRELRAKVAELAEIQEAKQKPEA